MRRSKYGAIPETVDGHRFASRKEARHFGILKLRGLAGELINLEIQPRFPLIVNGQSVGAYVADFRYQTADGQDVIEDVKGIRTAVYRIKKRMVEAQYGIQIQEV